MPLATPPHSNYIIKGNADAKFGKSTTSVRTRTDYKKEVRELVCKMANESEAKHIHSPLIRDYNYIGGNNPTGHVFQLENDPPFSVDCFKCCWTYLVQERKYTKQKKKSLIEEIVKFNDNEPTSQCIAVNPENDNGYAILRDHDYPNYQHPWHHLNTYDSRTYQLYTHESRPTPALGERLQTGVRVNYIPLIHRGDALQKAQLDGCYFNYADAALLELHMEENGKPSLKGYCCYRATP